MNIMRWLRPIYLFSLPLLASQFEGIWEDCQDRKPFFMSFFLPYNPLILTSQISLESKTGCLKTWPKAVWRDSGAFCDLFWVEQKDALPVLQSNVPCLQKAKVVYTFTQISNFKQLRDFLEPFGF